MLLAICLAAMSTLKTTILKEETGSLKEKRDSVKRGKRAHTQTVMSCCIILVLGNTFIQMELEK